VRERYRLGEERLLSSLILKSSHALFRLDLPLLVDLLRLLSGSVVFLLDLSSDLPRGRDESVDDVVGELSESRCDESSLSDPFLVQPSLSGGERDEFLGREGIRRGA